MAKHEDGGYVARRKRSADCAGRVAATVVLTTSGRWGVGVARRVTTAKSRGSWRRGSESNRRRRLCSLRYYRSPSYSVE